MLVQQAHRYSILRSTFHDSNTHGVGVRYNLTGQHHAPRSGGEPQPDRRDPPCMGSAVRQLRGDRNGLPAAVQLPRPIGDQNSAMWGGQHAGYLGPRFDPLFLFDETWRPGDPMPGFTAAQGVDVQRQSGRTELARTSTESTASYRRGGTRLRTVPAARTRRASSRQAWRAFSLDNEPRQLIERYGDNRFGRSCLVARRLIEAGVGFVTVPWLFRQSEQNFDTHSRNFSKMKDMLLPPVDRAFSALLEDLAQRGLLGETLVAWTGEFGRTPLINRDAGRDHWGRVYSTVLAGGGVRGGQVVGRSDPQGGAVPADNPIHVSDFVATIYHCTRLWRRHSRHRPVRPTALHCARQTGPRVVLMGVWRANFAVYEMGRVAIRVHPQLPGREPWLFRRESYCGVGKKAKNIFLPPPIFDSGGNGIMELVHFFGALSGPKK